MGSCSTCFTHFASLRCLANRESQCQPSTSATMPSSPPEAQRPLRPRRADFPTRRHRPGHCVRPTTGLLRTPEPCETDGREEGYDTGRQGVGLVPWPCPDRPGPLCPEKRAPRPDRQAARAASQPCRQPGRCRGRAAGQRSRRPGGRSRPVTSDAGGAAAGAASACSRRASGPHAVGARDRRGGMPYMKRTVPAGIVLSRPTSAATRSSTSCDESSWDEPSGQEPQDPFATR